MGSVSQMALCSTTVPMGLDALPPFALLDLDRRGPATTFSVTTAACVQYLQAERDDDVESRDDAFEHLTAIMLTATAGLYIFEDIRSTTEDSAKYRFVRSFLMNELEPWRGKRDEEIEAAARGDKFRYLGKRCRSRVLNAIRDTQRERVRFERYNDDQIEHQPARQNVVSREEFDAMLAQCSFLTPRNVATAKALFDLRGLKRTRWAAELAKQRGVSVQTGRKYIRRLRARCQEAVESGNRAAQRLFKLLAGDE